MSEQKVTVFTPAYNRAYTLGRLYESLLKQTDKRFCWLIVDDGSTDQTEELVSNWIKENRIDIEYYKQENQGKPAAHNTGVELTKTELFTCVDSDDYLTDNAVGEILNAWERKTDGCIGILGYIERKGEGVLTKCSDNSITKGTLRYLYDHGLSGDTILIFQTKTLKKYKFPKFNGEKFIPEAYLYDLLDQEGELFLLKKAIYICEYLPDGYKAGMAKLLYNNPQGYFCYINQRLKLDKSLRQRIADSIRYDAMAIAHKKKKIVGNAVYPLWALLAYPAGWLFYKRRYAEFR